MNDWALVRAADFIDFNPRESVAKGAMTKKVGMEHLQPFTRDIPAYEVAPFNGGSKFRNDDTLMARITPCLENGKTSQVSILDDGEVGFGSTEFIVLRAKPGISDKDFVYYLAMSPLLRDKAIKSMVGSSGRQRVQQGVLNDLEFYAPPLTEQVEIGYTLRSLDDKIANNTKINNHLEQMAQAIFKSWFVDFEPFGGVMPSDWREATLGDVATITSGKRPPFRQATASDGADIPLIGASSIMGFTNAILYDERILITGRVGTHGVIQRYSRPCWASDNTLVIKSDCYEFVYQQLCIVDFHNMNRGSTQPLITQTDLKNVSIILPDAATLHEFETLVRSLMERYEGNILESERLTDVRDAFLPRLMSGELSVADAK
ncbi:type I restriction endonuclease subunit S [Campylobacterota bacterium]|nr:type I restriction endonuclease subunit S [Campylobacterota bacterium]